MTEQNPDLLGMQGMMCFPRVYIGARTRGTPERREHPPHPQHPQHKTAPIAPPGRRARRSGGHGGGRVCEVGAARATGPGRRRGSGAGSGPGSATASPGGGCHGAARRRRASVALTPGGRVLDLEGARGAVGPGRQRREHGDELDGRGLAAEQGHEVVAGAAARGGAGDARARGTAARADRGRRGEHGIQHADGRSRRKCERKRGVT